MTLSHNSPNFVPASRPPLGALLFVSTSALGLNGLRVFATGEWRWLFLSWNLVLAWTPLALACASVFWWRRQRRWKSGLAAAGWLLFLPNAPYLITDLVHLGGSGHLFWLDLMMVSLFALTGLVVGLVSLRLMQEIVASRGGWMVGWIFAGAVVGLSAVGVFMGRFLRWNSWDLLLNPGPIVQSLIWPGELPISRLKFTLLFAAFLFLAYVLMTALTQMRSRHPEE